MKIVYWGKGDRGVACLRALHDHGHQVELVVAHPPGDLPGSDSVAELAMQLQISVIRPDDPTSEDAKDQLQAIGADLFILGGYGKILHQNILNLPAIMCINLHGGRLPQYRGSSPLNWALINGDSSFGLSIIRVDCGVDTGDVILDLEFVIGTDDTIADLHRIANREFPGMLLEALSQIESGDCRPRPQEESTAAYYPRRFPDDGLVLFDALRARQIHDRVRALTDPYPGAFTFFQGRKVKLIASSLRPMDYHGEPGRIYRKSPEEGLLVCAADKCLWLREAIFVEDSQPLYRAVKRYDKLATLSDAAIAGFVGNAP